MEQVEVTETTEFLMVPYWVLALVVVILLVLGIAAWIWLGHRNRDGR